MLTQCELRSIRRVTFKIFYFWFPKLLSYPDITWASSGEVVLTTERIRKTVLSFQAES